MILNEWEYAQEDILYVVALAVAYFDQSDAFILNRVKDCNAHG